MTRSLLRLVAIVALLGQLLPAGGALFCAQRQDQPVPCGDARAQHEIGDPQLGAPSQDLTGGPCPLAGPCAATAPAVTVAVLSDFAFPEHRLGGLASASLPASFHPVPIPPPPQA